MPSDLPNDSPLYSEGNVRNMESYKKMNTEHATSPCAVVRSPDAGLVSVQFRSRLTFYFYLIEEIMIIVLYI